MTPQSAPPKPPPPSPSGWPDDPALRCPACLKPIPLFLLNPTGKLVSEKPLVAEYDCPTCGARLQETDATQLQVIGG